MKLAKWALITTLSLSLSAAFAERRKPSGNHGSKPSASHSKPHNSKPSAHKPKPHNPKPVAHKPKPKPHNPKPVNHSGPHGCKAGDYFWGGNCHSYPKPVSHNTDIHYGHAYSGYYSSSYPYYYNGYYYGSPWWHNQPSHGGGYVGGGYVGGGYVGGGYVGGGTTVDVTCSPETMTKNTFAAEAVLVGLAQNELANQEIFTQKVSDFVAMSGAQKVDAGLTIAGVKNPKDAKEVLALIYAREPSSESIARVSENLNLDSEQAKLVVVSVSQALKQR